MINMWIRGMMWMALRGAGVIRDDPRQEETGVARECQPRGAGLNSSGFTNRRNKHTPEFHSRTATAGRCLLCCAP